MYIGTIENQVSYRGDVVIPREVTVENKTLKVTAIGEKAFYYCYYLTSINIPYSVISIGEEAFFNSGLTSMEIPNSVTSIHSSAFYNCNNMTSITIPISVTSINRYAFWNCSRLTTIISQIKEPFDIGIVFSNSVYDNATLYVPSGTKSKYEATKGWRIFKNIVENDLLHIDDS